MRLTNDEITRIKAQIELGQDDLTIARNIGTGPLAISRIRDGTYGRRKPDSTLTPAQDAGVSFRQHKLDMLEQAKRIVDSVRQEEDALTQQILELEQKRAQLVIQPHYLEAVATIRFFEHELNPKESAP